MGDEPQPVDRSGPPGGDHRRGRWAWLFALVALAAAAVAALVVIPRLRADDPDPAATLDHEAVGEGEVQARAAELWLEMPTGDAAAPGYDGKSVPAGAELALGGRIPADAEYFVLLEHPLDRELVWHGVGDQATARGGPLRMEGEPVVIRVPGPDPFALELWLGRDPSLPGARRVQRLELTVTPDDRGH